MTTKVMQHNTFEIVREKKRHPKMPFDLLDAFTPAAPNHLRCLHNGGKCLVFLDGLPHHGIDTLTQFLARLEVWHALFRHHYFVTRLGIATYARRPAIQRKAAKTTNLNALAGRKCIDHCIEYGFDRVIRILGDKLRITLSQASDQLRLGHYVRLISSCCRTLPSTVHPGWWYRKRHWSPKTSFALLLESQHCPLP